VQRWQRSGLKDRRKGSRAQPGNALSDEERKQIISLLVCPRYRDLNPNQLVPQLADRGIYLGSESTLYRLLREQKMNRHRAASKPATHHRPKTHVACGPNQVWTWDISYLPTCVAGVFLYLYLMVDICSRKIVAWQVHDRESQQLGAALVAEACFLENIDRDQITLHSDNGSPMKGATMLATLQKLGIMASFSRPSVSNDNPFSESLFRTLKYRPQYPEHPFADIDQARAWVEGFVAWYNTEHLHSGIRFIRPDDRHSGKETAILKKRHDVYQQARKRHPERWSGNTRNWSPVGAVVLNKTNQSEKEINKAT
jgi:transposase InsO family protein